MNGSGLIPAGVLQSSEDEPLPFYNYMVRNRKNVIHFRLKKNTGSNKYDVILLNLPGSNWTEKTREDNHIFLLDDGTYWVCTKENLKPISIQAGIKRAITFIEQVQIYLDTNISLDQQYKRKILADSSIYVQPRNERPSIIDQLTQNTSTFHFATDRNVGCGKIVLIGFLLLLLFRACSG